MFPFFQSPGASSDCHDFSNVESGSATASASSLRTLGCIFSGPIYSCIFRFLLAKELCFLYTGAEISEQWRCLWSRQGRQLIWPWRNLLCLCSFSYQQSLKPTDSALRSIWNSATATFLAPSLFLSSGSTSVLQQPSFPPPGAALVSLLLSKLLSILLLHGATFALSARVKRT